MNEPVSREKLSGIRALLERSKEQLRIALPKHMTPERMMRVAITTVQRTPKLLDCTPLSLIGAIVQASQLGLEPDGVLGHAYLIPFQNKKTGQTECQMIPGYRGLIDLARRTGQVSTIYARAVHQNDDFDFCFGLTPKLEHRPTNAEQQGEMVAAYAVCHLRDGGVQFDWMWRVEIEAIRRRSRAANAGPWMTDYEEMAKKTVLRRLCKLLPLSVEFLRAAMADELFDTGLSETSTEMAPLLSSEAPRNSLDALADRLARAPDAMEAEATETPAVAELST